MNHGLPNRQPEKLKSETSEKLEQHMKEIRQREDLSGIQDWVDETQTADAPLSAQSDRPPSQGSSIFSDAAGDSANLTPASPTLVASTSKSKPRPLPLHFSNVEALDLHKVPSSPRFNMRHRNRKLKSPWSQKPPKETEKKGPVSREKRRRMTAELQASVDALGVKDDFTFPSVSHTIQSSPAKAKTRSPTKSSFEEPEVKPRSMTLWSYLLLELASQKNEAFSEEKSEQLVNFTRVPLYLERVITFGTLMCLDSFLHFFTILPLRFIFALYTLCKNTLTGDKTRLPMSRKADVIKGFMFALILSLLLQLDTSKIYHIIRGQSAVKLYVMFNVLEIADKLFSALGQDILECLFSYEILQRHYKDNLAKYYRPLVYAVLGIVYIYFHSLAILYQIISLNVAVNSYSNALLTLLLSNQFAEIKSAVFKKFERENLFQLACADITERFQLTTMLFIIGLRNIAEVGTSGLIPRSWSGWNTYIGALMGPMSVVVGSELMVDWLKHAYIAKFNNIRPRVYRKFLDVLAYDYSENSFADDVMMKRIGLPIFPIACVFFRMLVGSYSMLAEHHSSSRPVDKIETATITTIMPPNATNALEAAAFDPEITAFPLNVINDLYTTSCNILSDIQTGRINFDDFYRYLSLTLVGITIFALLFALKLMLGLSLLQYSTRKRSQLLAQTAGRPHTNPVTAAELKQRASQSHTEHNPSAHHRPSHTGGYESDQNDYAPGIIKGGPQNSIELPKHLRDKLYYPDEAIPLQKTRKKNTSGVGEFLGIERFKMTAKQIW